METTTEKKLRPKTHLTVDVNTKVWLTNDELKVYLGFGSDTLFKRWRDEGRVAYHRVGGMFLYARKDIDNYIKSRRSEKF